MGQQRVGVGPLRKGTAVAIAAGVGGVLVLVLLLRVLSGVLVDYWWFDSLGYGSVYRRILLAKVLLWLIGFAAAFAGAASGFMIARRYSSPVVWVEHQLGRMSIPLVSAHRLVWALCWAGAVVAGLIGGGALAGLWHRVLLFLNRVPFGVADPVFGNDVGFYVFAYPLAVLLRRMLLALVWVSFAGAVAWYAASGAFVGARAALFPPRAFSHLSKTVGIAFVVVAAGHFLDRYALLYSTAGVSFGAGYTDLHARLPAHWLMVAVSLGVAGLLFWAGSPRRVKGVLIGLGVWLGCMVVAEGLLPALVQSLRVTPNESRLEEPYIRRTIESTLRAYKLDALEEREYPVVEDLTYEAVTADETTISNVRLWDWRPLRETFRQIQAIRSYYDFNDVDVDRYDLARGPTQMSLSVRELAAERLPPEAQTWVNLRLKYTHGYGLCMSPVNEFTREGLPVLAVRDIPPTAPERIRIDRPQVYYGESTGRYVFVRTAVQEFDYPLGEGNAWTRYEGAGGVPIGGLWRKLVFALELRDPKVLLSSDLTPGSRILYRRLVAERVSRLAPYLLLDHDAYPVVHAGRIYWVQDAYTRTTLYPYSEPIRGRGLNYMRNAVKAVVDAYEGSVTFYVADESDPLIRAYSGIFPGLYRPMADMPEGLRRHVRYPIDLFEVQADKYATFHMRDPQVFYTQEDPWEVAQEKYHGQKQRVESYYVIMRLPGSERAEFLVMLPFTPKGRINMIAWLAGRCDGDAYGKLVAFVFPKGKQVDGPLQIENYIDQDPTISQQLTLWNQGGSGVVRGNLLVIPIAGGLLYVEPLYIRADADAIPQLKRVLTATGKRVAMAPTLEESLRALFAQGPPPAARPEAAPAPAAPVPAAREPTRATGQLVQAAVDEFDQAQQALRAADWQEYGRRMDRLKAALDALSEALGQEGG